MKRRLLVLSLALVALLTAGVSTPADAASGSVFLKPSAIRTAKATTVFAGGLYVQPDSDAASAVKHLKAAGLTSEAKAAKYIAKRPVATWLGDWARGKTLKRYIERNLAAAEKQGTTPVFVTYALPDRDCGGHSAGGLSAAAYVKWNALVARTLKGHHAVVLIEPDSLFILDSCAPGVADARFPLLRTAVSQFTKAGIPAYLDGGVSGHAAPQVIADRLNAAGIAKARGFYTNVANYQFVEAEQAYAATLSSLTGNARYVIDVSRSGRGYTGDWCNSPGAGLGQDPTVVRGGGRLDALLWVKTPGASDGECNGGPAAGQWFAGYAVALVANRAR